METFLITVAWGFILGTLAWCVVGAVRDAQRGRIIAGMDPASPKGLTFVKYEGETLTFFEPPQLPDFSPAWSNSVLLCAGMGVCPFCGPYDREREPVTVEER